RDQELAVGAEREGGDASHVTAEAVHQRPGLAVPDLHGAILSRRGDPPATGVGAERRRPDVPAMSAETVELLACLHVPDLDRVLLPPRDQAPAVRTERQVESKPGGPRAEGAASLLLLPQSGRVPELHRAVTARRSQVPTVGAETQPLNIPVVVAERADLAA